MNAAGAKILLIEDDPVQRDVTKERFASEGFTVLEADDGAKGLAMALDRQPDVILLDIRMPNMSGFEMLKHLRSTSDWGSRVPVIFLTNIAPSADAEADIEAVTPAHYLMKSNTSLEELVRKVRELL